MNEKIDIYELIRQCPDTMIHIRAGDLGLFGRKLIAESRLEFERQLAKAEAEKSETYLDAETVINKLGISTSTLYRLSKAQAIKVYRLGGKRKYRLSEIEKLVQKAN